jgi:hypothetical protein
MGPSLPGVKTPLAVAATSCPGYRRSNRPGTRLGEGKGFLYIRQRSFAQDQATVLGKNQRRLALIRYTSGLPQ